MGAFEETEHWDGRTIDIDSIDPDTVMLALVRAHQAQEGLHNYITDLLGLAVPDVRVARRIHDIIEMLVERELLQKQGKRYKLTPSGVGLLQMRTGVEITMDMVVH
jgi:predicted transcriptional regulator